MAFSNLPFYAQGYKHASVKIQPGDTTTLKTLWTAGAQGSKIVALFATSDDSANEDVQAWLNDGTIDSLLGTKQVLANSGFTNAVAATNLFDGVALPWLPIDRDGQRYLFIKPSGILKVNAKTTITAAKTLYLNAIGADY